jgi:hypothetical protein
MPDNEADALASRRVQGLAQELRKETIAELKDTAGDRARRKVFDRKQLLSDADLEVGGHIQKLVALELRASGAKRHRLLWEDHGGRATVRNTVRKKRQTSQNSMKIAFRGEWESCHVLVCLMGSVSIANMFFSWLSMMRWPQSGLLQPTKSEKKIHQSQKICWLVAA